MISINLKKRFLTGLLLSSIVVLIFNYKIFLAYFLIVFGIFSIIEFSQMIIRIFFSQVKIILLNIFFSIYVFLFCLIFFFFSYVLELKFIVFILLIGCIASDIGGYFFGKIFKGPKLTRISPNKTYAGVVGSLLFSLIAISCLFFYFIDIFNYSVVIISLITSISCQLGDLLFSFLKRKAKVKDTGSILPGHGGILDRLDGIFLGVPMGFLTLILIG